MNRKNSPKLEPGHVKIVALPDKVYDDLLAMKEPVEPFYGIVQRLIAFYKDRQ